MKKHRSISKIYAPDTIILKMHPRPFHPHPICKIALGNTRRASPRISSKTSPPNIPTTTTTAAIDRSSLKISKNSSLLFDFRSSLILPHIHCAILQEREREEERAHHRACVRARVEGPAPPRENLKMPPRRAPESISSAPVTWSPSHGDLDQ